MTTLIQNLRLKRMAAIAVVALGTLLLADVEKAQAQYTRSWSSSSSWSSWIWGARAAPCRVMVEERSRPCSTWAYSRLESYVARPYVPEELGRFRRTISYPGAPEAQSASRRSTRAPSWEPPAISVRPS